MNRERQHIDIFKGKRTRCLNCKKPIKHGQKTIIVKWFDHFFNRERYTRFCDRNCADEYYHMCLSRKCGVYF